MSMNRSGADALLESLEQVGCRVLFGLPGTTVAPLIDRLLAYPSIRYVLTKHESCAVALADGYARVTQAPAVVSLYMVVGLANAISMIYNAHKARVPLVIIASQQDLALRLGTETVVDGDQLHLVSGVSRYTAEVVLADRVGEHFIRAYKQAAGPIIPGPSVLSIPRDALLADVQVAPASLRGFTLDARVAPVLELLERAAELICRAERPLLISGSQVASHGAITEMVALAELLGAPVAFEHFFNDRLGFPRSHPCSIGQFRASSAWVAGADVVVAAGCRLHHELSVPERPRIPTSAKVIQLNIEPEQLAMKHPVDVPLLADARSGLRGLRRAIEPRLGPLEQTRIELRRAQLLESTQRERRRLEESARTGWDDVPFKPWRVIRELDELAGDSARFVLELSSNMGCFYEYFGFRRPELVHSSSGCALGWGIGAAAGMKLADPDTPVIACVGDGALLFGLQTLWTVSNYAIAIVVVVFNNRGYHSTRLHTERLGGLSQQTGRYAGGDMSDDPTDCATLARGFGIRAERVTDASSLRPTLERALRAREPFLVDVPIDRITFPPMG